jgi:hypothetical protein
MPKFEAEVSCASYKSANSRNGEVKTLNLKLGNLNNFNFNEIQSGDVVEIQVIKKAESKEE